VLAILYNHHLELGCTRDACKVIITLQQIIEERISFLKEQITPITGQK
jgi:hypothetical protein